jgi:HD-like signal output (HDOD) protein
MSRIDDGLAAGEALLREALPSLRAWVEYFDSAPIPVLDRSAQLLEELRPAEDSVDAHLLGETFANDPLMVLKVLIRVAQLRRGREGSDAETLTAALVMLGITPFFRDFGPQRSVEAVLGSVPSALDGFVRVLNRAHRAARFALAFAVQRLDHDAAVIHDAALLHDFAELLMWIQAPTLMQEVDSRLKADRSLRSAAAQRSVLNVELTDLQHALMVRWRLPRLLIDISDDHRESSSAQARNVILAIRLARHTSEGWENPAVGDDVKDIASLLNLAIEPTQALLHDVDQRDVSQT